MENAMNGTQRRRKLLDMMRLASAPLSGGALGRETGVSRQVVVQDIALLRTMGYPILSTARGYVLNVSKHASRFFKVCHTNEQTEDELVTIVDLGGTVVDVMVNHRVYGKMSAPLNIKKIHPAHECHFRLPLPPCLRRAGGDTGRDRGGSEEKALSGRAAAL